MNITINETGEKDELSIIDPQSGIEWTTDLLGNHNALPDYNDETDSYHMSKEDFDWWKDLIGRYQEADDRYHELYQSLPEENAEFLADAVREINCDLENFPEFLQLVCNDYDETAPAPLPEKEDLGQTTYENWKHSFLLACEAWEKENAGRELNNVTTAKIAEALQADAYENIGGDRLKLMEWEHYDKSCAVRTDFQLKISEKNLSEMPENSKIISITPFEDFAKVADVYGQGCNYVTKNGVEGYQVDFVIEATNSQGESNNSIFLASPKKDLITSRRITVTRWPRQADMAMPVMNRQL